MWFISGTLVFELNPGYYQSRTCSLLVRDELIEGDSKAKAIEAFALGEKIDPVDIRRFYWAEGPYVVQAALDA